MELSQEARDALSREFYGMSIPSNMHRSLIEYICRGRPVGMFLESVLSNNLSSAVAHADDINIRNIPAYVRWLWLYAPAGAHGSSDAYMLWIAKYKAQEPTDG